MTMRSMQYSVMAVACPLEEAGLWIVESTAYNAAGRQAKADDRRRRPMMRQPGQRGRGSSPQARSRTIVASLASDVEAGPGMYSAKLALVSAGSAWKARTKCSVRVEPKRRAPA
jgi:hypothetical protein